ncbi:MAG: murein hydrolase activator EnvC family protein [Bacillota bacterium]
MFRGFNGRSSQPLKEFYQDKKYDRDYDWINYYRSGRKKKSYGWGTPPRREDPGRQVFYRIVAVLSILVILLAVRGVKHPVGENIRVGLRYILTTDWDVRPAMEKVVQYGLQVAGMDTQLDSGAAQGGKTEEVMGNNAIRGQMAVPVSGSVVREYGWSTDAIDDMDRFHHGIDIQAKQGTPVKAALAGTVKKVGFSAEFGRYILLDHGEGTYTMYGGVENPGVVVGNTVKEGEVIAYVAGGSDMKGGGLHFEVREKYALVDPMGLIELPRG